MRRFGLLRIIVIGNFLSQETRCLELKRPLGSWSLLLSELWWFAAIHIDEFLPCGFTICASVYSLKYFKMCSIVKQSLLL